MSPWHTLQLDRLAQSPRLVLLPVVENTTGKERTILCQVGPEGKMFPLARLFDSPDEVDAFMRGHDARDCEQHENPHYDPATAERYCR